MTIPSRRTLVEYSSVLLGVAAISYAIWPPDLDAPYITLGMSMFGTPLLGGALKDKPPQEPTPA